MRSSQRFGLGVFIETTSQSRIHDQALGYTTTPKPGCKIGTSEHW